ncbi:MAG TPA: hypothetical protein VF275_06065 [Gammaproteobacteria bacterium]
MQQVNLYQPILRQQKKVFSAVTIAKTLGVVALLMLGLYGFSYWQLQQLENEHRELQARQGELAKRVASLSGSLQAQPASRELRRRVEAAEREADLKQQLAGLLADRPVAEGDGFSAAFAGLARQRIAGLWLTGIEIHNAGHDSDRRVTLQGFTARAELVPRLVQLLGAEPAFAGLQFRRMHVFQPEDSKRDVLAFELTTEPPEKDASRGNAP